MIDLGLLSPSLSMRRPGKRNLVILVTSRQNDLTGDCILYTNENALVFLVAFLVAFGFSPWDGEVVGQIRGT